MMAVFSGAIFLLPFYLELVRNLSVARAGMILLLPSIIMDFHSDKYGTSMRSFLDLRYSYVYQNGHHNDRNDIPQKKC